MFRRPDGKMRTTFKLVLWLSCVGVGVLTLSAAYVVGANLLGIAAPAKRVGSQIAGWAILAGALLATVPWFTAFVFAGRTKMAKMRSGSYYDPPFK